ncbi:MAG TPA: hypothetical protein VGG48_01960 [Rhizomicrobium sp.]|jgi:energy-coupling factor transporter ATP-binding protein EcfA2
MYLLLLDDLDSFEDMRDEIIVAARAFFGHPPKVFEEFRFVSESGYGERVVDEIELVLSSHCADRHQLRSTILKCIDDWGFSEYRDYPVLTLSSGWRKYLSLALFVESSEASFGVLLVSAFHYLDSRRSLIALEKLAQLERVLIVDMDTARLEKLYSQFVKVVFRNGVIRERQGSDRPGSNANW